MSDDDRSTNYDAGEDGSRKKKPNSVTASNVSMSVYGESNSKLSHTPHDLFIQLNELQGAGDFREWCETARWIRYEENVEEGADRWGRPHVSSLCFHSLLNVRRSLESGVVLLDLEAKDFSHIVYQTVEAVRKFNDPSESTKLSDDLLFRCSATKRSAMKTARRFSELFCSTRTSIRSKTAGATLVCSRKVNRFKV